MEEKLTKKERRRATDAAIIDAAIIEFGEKGFARARVGDIAKRAGISQGLVSQNFGNKDRLFMMATSVIDEELFAPEGVEKKLPDILYAVIDAWKDIYHKKPEHFKLLHMLTCCIDFPEIIGKGIEARFRLSPVYDAIEEAQDKGDFPAEDPLEIMWDLFRATINMIYYYNKAGIELPENEFCLKLIGYKRKK